MSEARARAEAPAGGAGLDRRMLEFLVCPVTRGRLVYDAGAAGARLAGAGLAFPIQNGIPVMLVDEARRLDK